MFTNVELAAVPYATTNGIITLTINMVTNGDETLNGLRQRSAATRLPVYRTVTITSRIGQYRLDLGVHSENVEITALPSSDELLATTEPIASMLADYRERLTTTAIRLATHNFATTDRVAVAFDLTDLRYLSHVLAVAEDHWRGLLTRVPVNDQRSPLTSPWIEASSTAEPTSRNARETQGPSIELSRVRQLRHWFGRLLDLAEAPREDEDTR